MCYNATICYTILKIFFTFVYMTLEEAVQKMLELPKFKEDFRKDAKLRVFTSRWKKKGQGLCKAREYLLLYGFTENYYEPSIKQKTA